MTARTRTATLSTLEREAKNAGKAAQRARRLADHLERCDGTEEESRWDLELNRRVYSTIPCRLQTEGASSMAYGYGTTEPVPHGEAEASDAMAKALELIQEHGVAKMRVAAELDRRLEQSVYMPVLEVMGTPAGDYEVAPGVTIRANRQGRCSICDRRRYVWKASEFGGSGFARCPIHRDHGLHTTTHLLNAPIVAILTKHVADELQLRIADLEGAS